MFKPGCYLTIAAIINLTFMWRHFLKDYFNYTKKERYGIIALVSIVLIVVTASFLFPSVANDEIDHSQFENEIARLTVDSTTRSLKNTYADDYYNDYSPGNTTNKTIKAEVFFFDPNTASIEDWVRLGIKEKTAATIQKYISKGGKFRRPEDIKKIWGLRPADADRLLPYVKIQSVLKDDSQYPRREYTSAALPYVKKAVPHVDINVADTSALIALPGIGSKLAQRIIAFREKLGGFYSTGQVAETYFLPDSTFQKIKPYLILNEKSIKQININVASLDEMKSHPYIKYNLANAIVQYRKQHGNFTAVEEVKKIMMVTDEIYDKVFPYFSVQ